MENARQPIPGLNWYDVSDPASPALDELAKRFSLHELQIEDCRHGHQRPKVEEREGYIFTVLKHLHSNQELDFRDYDIFLGHDYMITVHPGDTEITEELVRSAADAGVKRLDRLFYMAVDLIVDDYVTLIDQYGEDIAELENAALQSPTPDVLSEIFHFRRQLINVRRVAIGMREVVNTLIRREGGLLGDDLDPYLRDVYDHLVRDVDLVETYRDLLTGSLDVYLSAVANRTNEVMKVLTVYGTLAIPLLFITGLYGMNVKLPWQDAPHAFWDLAAVMAGCVLVVLVYFKRKKWF